MRIHALFPLCLLLVLASCDPKEYPPKALGYFDKISSNGPVTFTLVQGAENQVISTSMMDSYYGVSGGQLSINGLGSMTIAIKNLKLLYCQSCTIKGSGPLVADTLNFYMHAGTLKLSDLTVNNVLQVVAINTGSVKLSGTAPFVNMNIVNLVSYEAYGLVTDSTYVNTSSIVTAEVNTTKVLNAFVSSIGDVNYKGDPPIVRATITGMGRLVKK
jgi:hypothetical protein